MSGPGLSDEQKHYLEGFLSAVVARRGQAPAPAGAADPQRAAQDRFLAAGRQLAAEEQAKRDSHPLDLWDVLSANAAAGRFPKGMDVFRSKFFGLFYVAPAQDAFMCRLRLPNGILSAHQLLGIAEIAERHAGGHADVTTRANLQLRRIAAADAVAVLMALYDLGIVNRGAGADNIRNITGSPTAGIDPQELIDTRPLARALHYHILNHRELYGLPRKFNIAFDGGGRVGVLADTNDIGFAAVAVADGAGAPAGVYFRTLLGGITGHGDFARDSGVLLTPEQCLPMAVAVLRVFIAEGDRSDRKRARLKYLLDAWGMEKFMTAVEKELGVAPPRLPAAACQPRGAVAPQAHIGIHPQKQAGLSYIGVTLPVGRITAAQLRGLAAIAERCGSGTIRLTVWQNLILSDIPDGRVAEAEAALAALDLAARASPIRAGLVACTGNTGCRFSATDTKGQALALAEHLEARVALDRPVTIHLTGCPHSCAQHAIGDIGLLGVKVGEEMIEGYTILVGGAADSARALAREIYPQVPMSEVPGRIERILRVYLGHRRDAGESFHAFAQRHSVEQLRQLCEGS